MDRSSSAEGIVFEYRDNLFGRVTLHSPLRVQHPLATTQAYREATLGSDGRIVSWFEVHRGPRLEPARLRSGRARSGSLALREVNTEFSEKQIQIRVAPRVTVDGRIDLIRCPDTGRRGRSSTSSPPNEPKSRTSRPTSVYRRTLGAHPGYPRPPDRGDEP